MAAAQHTPGVGIVGIDVSKLRLERSDGLGHIAGIKMLHPLVEVVGPAQRIFVGMGRTEVTELVLGHPHLLGIELGGGRGGRIGIRRRHVGRIVRKVLPVLRSVVALLLASSLGAGLLLGLGPCRGELIDAGTLDVSLVSHICLVVLLLSFPHRLDIIVLGGAILSHVRRKVLLQSIVPRFGRRIQSWRCDRWFCHCHCRR
mmetsp:Transcript_22481/g.53298  ORF Transcript_22481/g.53298 Transcript_22481/m.53298 type:complete len:201 (+) Transcript_22481:789-1391(+)